MAARIGGIDEGRGRRGERWTGASARQAPTPQLAGDGFDRTARRLGASADAAHVPTIEEMTGVLFDEFARWANLTDQAA